MTEKIDEMKTMLGEGFKELKNQLEEITTLLKGNVRENWNIIVTKLEAFGEAMRINPNLGLELKAKLANTLSEIRTKFLKKAPEAEAVAKDAKISEKGAVEGPSKFPAHELSEDASKLFHDPSIPKPTHSVMVQ